jgi:hypothetical protein
MLKMNIPVTLLTVIISASYINILLIVSWIILYGERSRPVWVNVFRSSLN